MNKDRIKRAMKKSLMICNKFETCRLRACFNNKLHPRTKGCQRGPCWPGAGMGSTAIDVQCVQVTRLTKKRRLLIMLRYL